MNNLEESIIRQSGENIIEQIRESRNDVIKKLTDVNSLRSYLKEKHELPVVSSVKAEFIVRALKELQATPVDLSHYGSLILETRKRGAMVISKTTEQLFFKDIDQAIKNYLL